MKAIIIIKKYIYILKNSSPILLVTVLAEELSIIGRGYDVVSSKNATQEHRVLKLYLSKMMKNVDFCN